MQRARSHSTGAMSEYKRKARRDTIRIKNQVMINYFFVENCLLPAAYCLPPSAAGRIHPGDINFDREKNIPNFWMDLRGIRNQ